MQARRQHPIQRFLIVGGMSTAVNYTVFVLLHVWIGYSYEASYVVGFLSGVLFSYGLNRAWTFQIKSGRHSQDIWRYLIVYTLSLLIGLVCIKLAVDVFNISPLIANIGAILVTTCTNYTGIRSWAFNR